MSTINPATVDPLKLPSLPLSRRSQLPNIKAVYFVLESEKVIYIGKTLSLTKRWIVHHKYKEIKERKKIKLAWIECHSVIALNALEAKLIRRFKPELNRSTTKLVMPEKRERMRGETKHLKDHQFKPLDEKPLRRVPVSVKLPPDVDDYVRSQPNRNQWLIAAIRDRMAKEQHGDKP